LFDRVTPNTDLPVGRIFTFGLIGLYILLAVSMHPHSFVVSACIVFLVAIGVGFTFIPPNAFSATWLPGIETENAELRLLGADIVQNYPQALFLRTRLKNLWVLASCVLAGTGALAWVLRNPNPMPHGSGVFIFRFGFAPIVWLAYKWVRERWVLRHEAPVIGLITRSCEQQVAYEFYFTRDERHGDIVPFYLWSEISPLIIVFVNPRNPMQNEPSFNLLFHKIEIVDQVHWPESRFKSVVGSGSPRAH